MNTQPLAALALAAGLAVFFGVLVLLARWARRRSKGALISGALLSIFAPDPEFEKNVRLAERARQVQCEEDEEGEKR